MPRRKVHSVDQNQGEIVAALKAVGASVQSLADVGGGCPDLLVGFRGKNYLLEVKSGSKISHRRPKQLRPDQEEWHRVWTGSVCIVESIEEALSVVTATWHT